MTDQFSIDHSHLPKVFLQRASALERVQGGRFAPVSVEISPDGLVCNWLYYPDSPLHARDSSDAESFATLTHKARQRGRAAADTFARLTEQAHLEDSSGMTYRRRGGGAGSSDVSPAMSGHWTFTPPPAPTVSRLHLRVAETDWELRLDDPETPGSDR